METKKVSLLSLLIFLMAVICSFPLFYFMSPSHTLQSETVTKYFSFVRLLLIGGNLLSLFLSVSLFRRVRNKIVLIPLIFSSAVLLYFGGLLLLGWMIFGNGP
ncbi:hypothetical protein ACWN8V_01545 [Vagococcus elongatus]|uniref:Uncharacterized protein n=1 Tax=Vagococcus elongatus TaxID=180344 RepID=A0A430B4J3_9ENTE|nr:hypothetical protein [Vagococcus elongatus]RSU15266.1 hypothetical protein CBF29_02730 [Vagococcus elongatus]